MNFTFNEEKPIYEQIINFIRRKIAREEFEPGDKLPSQRKMAGKLEVNPNTIQRAYREMEAMDLVETKRGKGTFIINSEKIIQKIKKEMAEEAIQRFIGEMISLGFSEKEIMKRLENNLEKEDINA